MKVNVQANVELANETKTCHICGSNHQEQLFVKKSFNHGELVGKTIAFSFCQTCFSDIFVNGNPPKKKLEEFIIEDDSLQFTSVDISEKEKNKYSKHLQQEIDVLKENLATWQNAHNY